MATRRLVVEVVGDASSLSRTFRGASADSAQLGGSLGRLSIGLGQLAKGVIEVDVLQKAFEGLSEAVHLGIEGFTDTTKVAAQTAAVIKSTGDASNLSAKQIHALAASLSNVSGIDDEVIQSAENVLSSFVQIRDFAGKNNDIFTRATKVITDYASRTGKDASQAAVIFGRALADPATKAVALSRAGIVLTKSQLAALKSIEKTSGVVAAQNVLLKDLEDRFHGAAAAAGKTFPGELNILRERFKDLAGDLVGKVAPAFKNTVSALTATVVAVTEAKTLRTKLNIIWEGVGAAVNALEADLKTDFAKIDWAAIWSRAGGIADGLTARVKAINWGTVGGAIGDGIAKSVSIAASATKAIAQKLENIFKAINFVALGKAAGPGLAAAIVTAFTTLTDPTFWIKNWQLALAVASVAFGDGLGRLGLKLAEPFAKLGADLVSRFGATLAEGASSAIERLGTKLVESGGTLTAAVGRLLQKLGSVVLEGLLRLPGIADRALATLIGPFVRAFTRLNGLAKLTIKIIGAEAVINEIANVVGKIAHLFGSLAGVIGHALDGAWKTLETGAIKAALAIVKPFAEIPGLLGGGPFKSLQAKLQADLAAIQNPAFAAGKIVGASVVAGINAGLQGPIGTPNLPGLTGPTATPAKPIGSRNASAGFTPGLPPPPPAPKAKGLTATQRNTFFDNAISSDLTRAGFVTNIKAQISALQNIAGLVSARIAATKDVTRRRTLEDQLLGVESQITGDKAQVAQDFLASLQFGITKAQATATFKDDIPAFTALENGIKAQIKATGDTQDLQQQLFDAVQGLKAAKSSQLSAKDFQILGFGPTGDDITPGLKRLRTEYANVISAISGTSLDTTKVRTELAAIKKIISDSLVPPDVREKMQQLLADLEGQLQKAGSQLGFKQLDVSKLVAQDGLTGLPARRLEAQLSQIGKGGTVPNTGVGAFGVGVPTGSSAGGKGLTITPSTVVLKIDQNEIGRASMAWKVSHDRRNPSQRRGPNAG